MGGMARSEWFLVGMFCMVLGGRGASTLWSCTSSCRHAVEPAQGVEGWIPHLCLLPTTRLQFVDAVNQLGVDKAVPKRILDLMNVAGLTRENVASHLQVR